MENKIEIKRVASSKAKLVFVKIPNNVEDLSVDNYRKILVGNLVKQSSITDWFSPIVSDKEFKFIGYSHNLSVDKILSNFASWEEFYQICNYHEIFYNYSAFTGKWAIVREFDEN